jgi:NitT/TauT family transport system ATP-binding protein
MNMGQGQLDAIEVRDVTRRFSIAKSPLVALERVSFSVPEGQVVAVVGSNGSGKSTLLRLIAGVLAPDEGSVLIQGTNVVGPDPRVGLAFQEPRLLPWRTVLENVAFPLELAGWERGRRETRARELLERVGVGFERAHPAQLSGGMSQRVGIARALALDPPVLLLDEPFSALDLLTRDRLNLELLRLWEATGSTVMLVTHSIPEAVLLADRVLVLSPRPGRLIADIPVGLPRPRDPAAVDTAGFSAAAMRIRELLGVDLDAEAGRDGGGSPGEVAA